MKNILLTLSLALIAVGAVASSTHHQTGRFSGEDFRFGVDFGLVDSRTLTIYGVEYCCSGVQQAQFKTPTSNAYVSFSNGDGLASKIPEPEFYAMLLSGLGLMTVISRRRKSRTA